MAIVGIRELKNHFSRYLRLVRRGERVVVTQRGVPVAVLSTAAPSDVNALPLEEKLKRLAHEGLVRLGDGSRFPRRVKAIKARGRPLSGDVIDDRR